MNFCRRKIIACVKLQICLHVLTRPLRRQLGFYIPLRNGKQFCSDKSLHTKNLLFSHKIHFFSDKIKIYLSVIKSTFAATNTTFSATKSYFQQKQTNKQTKTDLFNHKINFAVTDLPVAVAAASLLHDLLHNCKSGLQHQSFFFFRVCLFATANTKLILTVIF